MIVNYDLSRRPTTFDFASFCVFAKTCDATHVHFQADKPIEAWKYEPELAWKRFGNIVLPITKLAKMRWDVGAGQKGEVLPRIVHNMGNVNNCFLTKGKISFLEQTTEHNIPGPYVTITIRASTKAPDRNSNLEAWEAFRQYLKSLGAKVIVFEECELKPIDLEWRFAVYCGATMNLGVNNGPMALCMYSKAPYIVMKQGIGVPADEAFPEGSQWAFANEKQRLFWEEDSFDNIKGAWQKVMQ